MWKHAMWISWEPLHSVAVESVFFPNIKELKNSWYRITVFENNLPQHSIQSLYSVRNLAVVAAGTVSQSTLQEAKQQLGVLDENW